METQFELGIFGLCNSISLASRRMNIVSTILEKILPERGYLLTWPMARLPTALNIVGKASIYCI